MRRISAILSLCLLFFSAQLHPQAVKNSSSRSVLSSGQWFRIAVTADGIYRLDYSAIKQKLSDPSEPKIFCNNSGQLSYYNNGPVTGDLKELAVFISKGSDGIFNEGDYLLFYGKSPHRWIYNETTKEYDFLRHNYSDTAFYFLTSGLSPGKRIIPGNEPLTSSYTSSQSDALFIYEDEYENILHSGRDWFREIYYLNSLSIKPGFTDLISSEKIKFSIRVAAQASSPTHFDLFEGTTLKKTMRVKGLNMSDYTGIRAQITDSTGYITAGSPTPEYQLKFYQDGQQGAKGWLDFVKLQARVGNSYNGKFVQLSDNRSVAPGRITEFNIKSQINGLIIWNVTDPYNIRQVTYTKTGDDISFREKTDSLKTFAVFTIENAVIPLIKSAPVPNQDLHGSQPADMIIITHPLFMRYAQRIADLHSVNNGLTSLIVTTEQVYNEFSGGIPDIAALRNFIRTKYLGQLGTSHPLKYLLLYGDGSFENKTPPPGNANYIPTYQSKNSNVVTSSFTSDDFYGLLEEGEGEAEGTEDIGIGRLPVSDTVEAGIAVTKIKNYLDPENMGNWRNIVSLMADDEDGNIHMTDAEGLAQVLDEKAPAMNIEKIYLDSFRQITNVNGQTYPEANKAVNDRINAGCLIFNYTGHGNENGLTAESVVKKEDIREWKNGGKLPLFITATCEFSRFDNVEINLADHKMTNLASAGEMALLNKNGGAIALMSTTRVVYSAPNYFLNRNIFNYAFERDSLGNTMALGDIIRIAKNYSGNSSNKRNFSLLGDPALKLAFPWHGKVITDSVNHIALSGRPDSLKALSVITVSGHIENPDGILLNNFSGNVSPIVYDKRNMIKTLANDGGPTMDFYMRNSILFSGKTIAKNGRFSFSFIVPRDINYSFGKGKISYYANNESEDMNGNCNDIIIGGFSNIPLTDTTGPVIKLYMNDTLFRNAGLTDENPVLLALLEDEGGINTSGSGIGHDLSGTLDNDKKGSFVLNNYYVNDFNNYKKGTVTYYLSDLKEGKHSITVKAWDNYNNSSEETIIFTVGTEKEFVLKNLFNYPNPFREETTITGEINRPNSELDISIKILSINGKIIKTLREKSPSTGYTLPPVKWDGNDDGGNRVAKGIYLYVVTVSTENGETARSSGRLIIL